MKDIKLFTIGYNEELADKVGKSLGVKVSELEIDHFADGEILVKLLDDVKDKDVFVIGSIAKPSNESLMELLIFVNAARNNGAKSIHIITPYMGYSRQDRVAKPLISIQQRQLNTLKFLQEMSVLAIFLQIITKNY